MMRMSANLPGWSDYPVRDEIERRLGARVFLDNDAKMAALGEKWLGAGRDVDNMAMVTLGTGIGGAIILNGKIFYGMNGMAGEFGHVTIEPERRSLRLRQSRMRRALRLRDGAGAHGARSNRIRPGPRAGQGRQFRRGVQRQVDLQSRDSGRRRRAKASSTASAASLGILLADLINILNLDMFVIGGGVVSAWDAFAPTMFAELRERSLVYAATAPDYPLGKKEGASARSQLHAQENHHHASPAGQRRWPLRRRQSPSVVVNRTGRARLQPCRTGSN